MAKASSKEVNAKMLSCFPACPICFQSKGYDVLGGDNDYVSCKKCNATWRSADFKNCEKLSNLTLTQPSNDDTGRPLLHKTLSVDFWQNWREKLNSELSNQAKARSASLLQCKNAVLTDKDFRYRSNDDFEKTWQISDMTMAMVQNNGSLCILFKDNVKREFDLGLDVWTKVSITGLALFGGVSSIIAGNMALNNQIKATSQQWASAINALIAKGELPEMIYCKYCGTKNKSIDPKCLHCGAILE
jgi:hypothetical protein